MSAIQPNDRVICIDATPVPFNGRGHGFSDFSYPGGYIVEGAIYCVEDVESHPEGVAGLHLVGHPVLVCGRPCTWSALRFRKIPLRSASTTISASITIPTSP